MQGFLNRLTDQAGRQLNASEARRSAMVCWIAAPVFGLLGIWALASHFLITDQLLFNHAMMLPAAAYAFGCVLLWLTLGVYGLRLDRRQQSSPRYTAMTLWTYAITSVAACYLIGTLNVVTGLVMMGAPMLGLILFSIRKVLLIFIAGLAMMLTLSLLSALQVIPYAPILHQQQTNSAHLNLYWTLCLMLAGGFYVIYQTVIMSAMVKAWHNREGDIRALSQTDQLTGVANRRHILEALDLILSNGRNRNKSLSVLMVDIDHFKRINDDHGHLAGDRALHAAAGALRDCLRQNEMIGRYGGEEFLILLPGAQSQHAMEIAERCRRAIGALVIDARGVALPLSASIGAASRSISEIPDSDYIIHLADEAMYEAKRAGRNQVVAA
jgi:diguanylate cyclase (GGDEF)-like protein